MAKNLKEVAQEVEANEVELGFDLEKAKYAAHDNPDSYLAKHVISKYPRKDVAWADKEHVTQSFRGWKILKWEQSDDSLQEVKSMDEATRRTSTVLAWRDIRIREAIEAQWKKDQQRLNLRASQDGTINQAKEFNQVLEGVSRGLLKAAPLSEGPGD